METASQTGEGRPERLSTIADSGLLRSLGESFAQVWRVDYFDVRFPTVDFGLQFGVKEDRKAETEDRRGKTQ